MTNQAIDMNNQSTLDLGAEAGRRKELFNAHRYSVFCLEKKLAKKQRNTGEKADKTQKKCYCPV